MNQRDMHAGNIPIASQRFYEASSKNNSNWTIYVYGYQIQPVMFLKTVEWLFYFSAIININTAIDHWYKHL